MDKQSLKDFLDGRVQRYNQVGFIENDPITIPHLFKKKQDIEIAGLFASILAWGKRKTIISKCRELMAMMDNDPYEFILHHNERDLKHFLYFKHRTFNPTDTLYLIAFLNWHYSQHNSLEDAFPVNSDDINTENALVCFSDYVFSMEDYPQRTKKHIPTPIRKSTCKRLNMYLRWMVRTDNCGVDFGLWKKIKPAQLICPCDVHVDRVGRKLGLITRKLTDWQTALELTGNLKTFDASDPVKYDFALFGLGIEEGWAGEDFEEH